MGSISRSVPKVKTVRRHKPSKSELYAAMVAATRAWLRVAHPTAVAIDITDYDRTNCSAEILASFYSLNTDSDPYAAGEPMA